MKHSEIQFKDFISNFIPLLNFIVISLFINFVFFACSCYDYWAIVCGISDKNRQILKTFSLILYAVLALNLLIPAIHAITKFRYCILFLLWLKTFSTNFRQDYRNVQLYSYYCFYEISSAKGLQLGWLWYAEEFSYIKIKIRHCSTTVKNYLI